jgi:hypothetical protein
MVNVALNNFTYLFVIGGRKFFVRRERESAILVLIPLVFKPIRADVLVKRCLSQIFIEAYFSLIQYRLL